MAIGAHELALLEAFVSIAGREDEVVALEQVVALACRATQAPSGAAIAGNSTGSRARADVGMTAHQVELLSQRPPVTEPLAGAWSEGVDPLADLAEASSLSASQLARATCVAVPILTSGSTHLGSIVLDKSRGRGGFSAADISFLRILGQQAGHSIALTPAIAESRELLRRLLVAERLSGQAVVGLDRYDPREGIDRLLAVANATLGLDLAFVTRVQDGIQRFAYLSDKVDTFGWSSGLELPAEEGYCLHMLTGALPHVVSDTAQHPVTQYLDVTATARLGAYVGVPITMPGGEVYGALCAVAHEARPELDVADEEILKFLSALVADQLVRIEVQEAERRARVTQMRTLLAPGGMSIVTQPIVDLRTGRPLGLEALARFPGYPEGPAEVFADAAELGLGADLELAAITAALETLADIPANLYLSINASPAAVLDPRLAPLLGTVDADRVVLELTEHVAVDDYDDLVAELTTLRHTGIRLAVDDAGSGYASLAHIVNLGPDVIKLDIALTRGIDTDPARQALACALVDFAADLGATLVAEGVETQAELTTLTKLGVVHGQGYHLGRPAPLESHNLSRSIYVGEERRRARPWSSDQPSPKPGAPKVHASERPARLSG